MKTKMIILLMFLLLTQMAYGAQEIRNPGFTWGIGIGRTVDRLPITLSKVSFIMSQVYVETPVEGAAIRYGALGLGGIIPVPRVEYIKTFLSDPCEIIVGAGVFYDFIFGGHGGVNLKAGVRLLNQYEISVDGVPFGTKNLVNYTTMKENTGGKGDIVFPYYTLTISTRQTF